MKNEEQIVSYETALLAKEMGFDWETRKYYVNIVTPTSPENIQLRTTTQHETFQHNSTKRISAPTQSLLQKWLREKHKLHVELFLTSYGNWCVRNIVIIKDADISINSKFHETYEDALEEGLEEALKLIK